MDADVGDDWTPKASAAFQRLKTELKSERVERETLTQRAKEAEAKVAELEGVVGSETVETLQQRVQEYENASKCSPTLSRPMLLGRQSCSHLNKYLLKLRA